MIETGADTRLMIIDDSLEQIDIPLAIDAADMSVEVPDCDLGPSGGSHNELGGLQGGNEAQRYHLDLLQYNALANANSPTGDNPVATMADITDFTDNIGSPTNLVAPVTTQTWSAVGLGDIAYNIPSPSDANIIVDRGAFVSVNAYYRYPAPPSGYSNPTAVSGDWGTTLPGPNTDSAHITPSSIQDNTTFTVTLSKPKTGLQADLTTGHVNLATGNDTTSAHISVTFKLRSYFGVSSSTVLNEAGIFSLGNKAFTDGKARTFTGVTASTSQYTYYAYPTEFGDLNQCILDGAAPVLGAFTRLTDVSTTNDAGIQVVMAVYRTNAPGAFTNNTLAFS